VPSLSLGTPVVQIYPRHPLALAGQALSVQAAIGNRLTLGIGPSHRVLVEPTLGLKYDRPAQHTREYLSALVPLLHGEPVDFHGEQLQAVGQLAVSGAEPPSVLVSALGPVMLRTAGELTDGTIAAWTGPRTISEHIVPRITAAAEAAGRPAPRVLVSVPVAVTDDADAERAWVAARFCAAESLPSYRAMLDIEGVSGVGDVVVVGDEGEVERQLRRLADAGATEFIATPFGPADQVKRTLEVLGSLNQI
jgi:F420-dependent oxidoreductase-like protein